MLLMFAFIAHNNLAVTEATFYKLHLKATLKRYSYLHSPLQTL